MMRRTPLQSRTGLHRGKPLERRTPLRAAVGLVTRKPPGGSQDTPRGKHWAGSTPRPGRPESFPPEVCAQINRRDSDDSGAVLVRLCQGCGSGLAPHRHHRRGKDAGGSSGRPHTHCACNGLTLCQGCHAWAHSHPEEARAMGWIVSQSVDEPGSVGVMRFAAAEGGATQWPSCSGEWLETAPEALEAA